MAQRTKPRGRRGPRKGDLKEQAILDTAERLLAKRPLAELGIEELAAGADISRPAFYFYFESKQAVLRALVGRIAEEMLGEADTWREARGAAGTSIHADLERAAELFRAHGAVLRAAIDGAAEDAEIGRLVRDATEELVSAETAWIERQRRAGAAPGGPPSARDLATALIAMAERAFYGAAAETGPHLREREIVDTLAAVWRRTIFAADEPPEDAPG